MSDPTHLSDENESSLLYLARRRAGAKLGWCIHASVYLCVNLTLMALAWQQGRHWAYLPRRVLGPGPADARRCRVAALTGQPLVAKTGGARAAKAQTAIAALTQR